MGVRRNHRIVVTGVGLVTPLGSDPDLVWRRIVRGESAAMPLPADMAERSGASYHCPVRGPAARGLARHLLMACMAAEAAVRDAGLEVEALAGRAGVSIGSSKGGLAVLEKFCDGFRADGLEAAGREGFGVFVAPSAASEVARTLGILGPVSAPVSACATGAHAILAACRMIACGMVDLVIAGAAESWITPLMLAGYRRMGVLAGRASSPAEACRPYDLGRCGFVPGEGSGIVVLEEAGHARARGARVRAELRGGAVGEDTFHATAPDPSGAALGDVIEEALRAAGLEPREIDYVNTHGTGTRLNDPAETRALKRAFGEAAPALSLSSTKPATGHLLGAAGSVEFIISVLALEHGIVPPTLNLKNPDPLCDLDYTPLTARRRAQRNVMSISCGFGGHIGVIVAGRAREDVGGSESAGN